jgi:hypothetical protein
MQAIDIFPKETTCDSTVLKPSADGLPRARSPNFWNFFE